MLRRIFKRFQGRPAGVGDELSLDELEQVIERLGSMTVETGMDVAEVADDLHYGLPRLLPTALREQLEHEGKLHEWIKESYFAGVGVANSSAYPGSGGAIDVNSFYEHPLQEWSWGLRHKIAQQVHSAYHRNPDAKAVNLLAYFAVGAGFQLITYHEEVEEYLDKFINHRANRIRQFERQAAKSLLVDGELVIRWELDPTTKMPLIAPKPPWHIQGIHHAVGSPRDVDYYYFVADNTTGDAPFDFKYEYESEPVPADQVTFVTINNAPWETRGRSELYAALPWLGMRKEWLENRARISYVLSQLLWHVKIEAMSVKNLLLETARWKKPPKSGSTAVTGANVEVKPLSVPPRGPEAADDGRQLLIQIAKTYGLSEYMMGDGANANLATATRQQLPALVKFEDYQRTLVEDLWKPLFRRALQAGIDNYHLNTEYPEQDGAGEATGKVLDTLKCFDITYKPVVEVNRKELVESLEIEMNMGLISQRSARRELGREPDQMEKEIAQEREQAMKDMAQGRIPLDPVFRPAGFGEEDDDDDDNSGGSGREGSPNK